MKYIKLFEQYLKENQLKLFPDYEKELPDNTKDVAMQYIKDRKVDKNYRKPSNNVQTWNQAKDFIDDEDNIELAIAVSRDTFTMDVLFPYDDYEEEDLDDDEIDEAIRNYSIDKNSDELDAWVTEEKGILYRAMNISDKLNDINKSNYDGVGVYWSYDRGMAKVYYSDYRDVNNSNRNTTNIILVAKVEPNDVNWRNTLYKSYYELCYEKEVELNKDTSIDIIGFEVSSVHPMFKDKDKKYFSEVLGLDSETIRYINKNKKTGYYNIELEEPIIVKT